MLARKYLFPGVIELNLQAARPLGVNIYLIDGGTEFALIDFSGGVRFPTIGRLPYLLTLAGHGFYWFRLRREAA